MAINFTTFFTVFGKHCFAGDTTQTALKTTIEDEVEDAVQELGTPAIEFEDVRKDELSGLRSLQGACEPALNAFVKTPMIRYLVEIIKADNQQPADTVAFAIRELIKQMEDNSESLDANVPAVTPSYGGSNVGNGVIVTSIKREDGKTNEHILAEDIEGKIVDAPANGAASLTLSGEPTRSLLAYNWPGGSGTASTLTSLQANSASNLAINGTFELEDTNATNVPDGWIASIATLGTTLILTDIEVQTVTISSSPTAGHYLLHWVNAAGDTQTTVPLAYDAPSTDVQAALTALSGLEQVTVTQGGTTPNFIHTITFTGVPGPAELTSTDNTTGGSIAHATTTAGSANVVRGARALNIVGDGAELTEILVPVTMSSKTQYALNLWAMTSTSPIAAGVITVALVDGTSAGTIIDDDAGTANSFTIDVTALTGSFAAHNGVFRTPTNMPDTVFLRIKVTTAITSTETVFIDELCLVEMDKLYAGGLYGSLFTGPTLWEDDDLLTLAVTNDRAGALHEWCDRVYSLRESELLIPTSGAPTQADSLIA